jgi:hypothetical protein
MRNMFSKLKAIGCSVLFSVVIIGSCTVGDLTKDLTIYTGNAFMMNPISIQIGDANHLETVPENMEVAVEGPDKDKIFTIFGESKIREVSGVVALAVKTSDAPSLTNRLEFTLILSAPNYLPVRKSYVLTESMQELTTDKVAMVNLTAAPKGISVQHSDFACMDYGAANDIAFASAISATKTEQARFIVKAGTKVLAANGSVLSGIIETELLHFDTRSEASLSGVPEGFSGITLKDATKTGKASINPAGFYAMTMKTGTTQVSKFSIPLEVTVDVDPNFFNEAQGRKVQAGDVLDIISRSESEAIWTSEAQATVVNTGGKLTISFKQPHLSIWIYGTTTRNVCIQPLKVVTDLPTAAKDANCSVARTSYSYKLVNANNPNIVYKKGTSTFGNGEILDNLLVADTRASAQLVVLNTSNTVIYTSPAQNLCTSAGTFNLVGKLPANKSVVAKLNVSAFCGGAVNTVFTPSNVTLFYRNMASPANAPFGGWAPLVTIVDGKACAKGLEAGQSYDFAMPVATSTGQIDMQTFSRELKQPNGLTIPVTGDFVVNVVSTYYNVNTTLTIKKQADGTYDLTYLKYPLPANICSELDKKFSVFLKK